MQYSDEVVQKMINALTEAKAVQEEYLAALEKLESENDFLAETITHNNLGKIVVERKKLLAENRAIKSNAESSLKEARCIRSEYEQKLDKITSLIKDVALKQSDIDSYIDSESDVKIQEQKDKLNNDYMKQKQKLQNEFKQKEAVLENKVRFLKKSLFVSISVDVIVCFIIIFFFYFISQKNLQNRSLCNNQKNKSEDMPFYSILHSSALY